MDETTLGSQHVVGIRLFKLDEENLVLTSLVSPANNLWLPGKIKRSQCNRIGGKGYSKPELDCSCGLWSIKDEWLLEKKFPIFLQSKPIRVVAKVQQWGVVIEHEYGYRSQYARIIPETIQYYATIPKEKSELINALRDKYSAVRR